MYVAWALGNAENAKITQKSQNCKNKTDSENPIEE
jgi:hypothetical protein